MKISLTKNEAAFIRFAAHLMGGFLDFESTSNKQFKQLYGFTKKQAEIIADSLRKKTKS